jgi:hypothetical protein
MSTPLLNLGGFLAGSAVGMASFYAARVPRFQIVAIAGSDYINLAIQQINSRHAHFVHHVKYITKGLEGLYSKGYRHPPSGTWYTPNNMHFFRLDNKTMQQFLEDCKASDVRTEVSVQYERPFLSGIKEKKEILEWSKASYKLE